MTGMAGDSFRRRHLVTPSALRNRNPIIRGNSSGAVFAAGLLCWPLPALLHAGILGVILTVMQLVGAKRYAVWTFCLTVIAFDLKSVLPQEIG